MTTVDHFLDGFFRPTTLAVVGATDNPFKINYRLLRNLVDMGFQGKIFPVNPSVKEINGLKAFPRLRDIPETIDLVVSAVPSGNTIEVVKECVECGVKRLVIVTGGFSEGGEEGRRLHEEIAALVKGAGIRTLGPNTLSPVNTTNNLIISFHHAKAMSRGRLSLVFQSGFYEPRLNWVFSHLGIGKILDTGNKMDINEVDALEYFAQDPETEVIAMHLESVRGDARRFAQLLREVSQQKPLIVLKSGRTRSGSRAAMSHTGALAGEN
ncbi:MAG: CoA-binding protein, partial [Desulfomonilaceae bacterium]